MSGDSAWEALIGTTMVGTTRGAGGTLSAGGALGESLARIDPSDPARAHLDRLALVATWRAGGRATTLRSDARPAPACEPRRPAAPVSMTHALRGILTGLERLGADRVAVPFVIEWLERLGAGGLRAPPETVAYLLEFAWDSEDPEVRRAVREGIGAPGRDVAAQRDTWFAVAGPRDPERERRLFETGSMQLRVSLFQRLRDEAREVADALLDEAFATEPAAVRTRWIELLAPTLAESDRSRVDAALTDRSKHVRAAAFEASFRLGNAERDARAAARARACVRVRKGLLGLRVEVTPPAELDDQAVADGLVRERDSSVKLGAGDWRLAQVLAAAPPSVWVDESVKPPALLAAIRKTDYGPALLAALTRAARRFSDHRMAAALYADAVTGGEGCGVMNPSDNRDEWSAWELVDTLPNELAERLCAALPRKRLRGAWHWLSIADKVRGPWSVDHAKRVLSRFADGVRSVEEYRYTAVDVPQLALRLPPNLLAPAIRALSDLARLHEHPRLDHLIQLLELRKRLHEETSR